MRTRTPWMTPTLIELNSGFEAGDHGSGNPKTQNFLEGSRGECFEDATDTENEGCPGSLEGMS